MIPKPPLAVALGACVTVPAVAVAGNGLEPRTPVDWPDDTACLTVVDRSESAMVHFDYGIPFEDPEITPDEVADSRRHQFIAFCRDHSREEFLPIWLTWKDVDAAAAKALIDPMLLEDENVLETSTVWKDCWFRITPDDARRPITFAEAMKGVDWDTTALAAGAYVVQGYTWEPSVNIYSQRPGIVHVVDGPDLAAVEPAAAVSTIIDFMFAEDTLMLEGCTRALPGSTLSGFWSHTGGALEWMPFAEEVAIDGETFVLPFSPPEDAVQKTVALRIDVTDPMQRTFSAYPSNLLTILPGSGGGTTTGCVPEGSFVVDPCDTEGTSEQTTAAATSTGISSDSSGSMSNGAPSSGEESSGEAPTTAEPTLTADADGCSCATGAPPSLVCIILPLLGLRRRRLAP